MSADTVTEPKKINMPLSCDYSITGNPNTHELLADAQYLLSSGIAQLNRFSDQMDVSDMEMQWQESFYGSMRLLDIAYTCVEHALMKD